MGGGIISALFLAATVALAQQPTPQERAFSVSQQFIVYGSTRKARMETARLADDLSTAFFGVTGLSTEWKWPVVVRLGAEPLRGSRQPRLSLLVGDGDTLRIQVDIPTGTQSGDPAVEGALLRALIMEIMYREVRPKPGKPFAMPPDWLVEAAWQEFSAKRDGLSADLFGRLVQSGPPPKLEAFLRQRPNFSDPVSRAIYRAQALTLLRALLSVREGRASLAAYLHDLHAARAEDPQFLLKAFPSLGEKSTDLVKLWTLEIARASELRNFEPLSVAESNSRLEAILGDLQSADSGKDPQLALLKGPDAMPAIARENGGRFILAQKAGALLRLESQAHPLFRPIVEEYRLLATQLAKKSRRDAAKRLAAVGELRAALMARGNAIADYLNWFEVTQMETRSGAFPEESEQPAGELKTRRVDAISNALDVMETSGSGR